MIEIGRRFYRFFTVANAVPGGKDRGKPRYQPYGHSDGRFLCLIGDIRIMIGQQGNASLQNIHSRRIFGPRF